MQCVNCFKLIQKEAVTLNKQMRKIILSISLLCLLGWSCEITVHANKSRYDFFIDDGARVLTDEQEEQLRANLDSFAQEGNIRIVTLSQNELTAKEYAREIYRHYQPQREKVIVFVVDLDNRQIGFWGCTYLYQINSNYYDELIEENAYSYFNEEKYFECIDSAFSQYKTLADGGRICQPMKYIANGMLAISLAVFINFGIMRRISVVKVQTEDERKEKIYKRVEIANAYAVYKETYVTYRKTN